MPRELRARLRCDNVTLYASGADTRRERPELSAVYSDDPEDPNKSFSDATPSAFFQLVIDNPEAHGFFEPGQEYDIIIRPRED